MPSVGNWLTIAKKFCMGSLPPVPERSVGRQHNRLFVEPPRQRALSGPRAILQRTTLESPIVSASPQTTKSFTPIEREFILICALLRGISVASHTLSKINRGYSFSRTRNESELHEASDRSYARQRAGARQWSIRCGSGFSYPRLNTKSQYWWTIYRLCQLWMFN